jgi:hypothetical protein
MAAAEKASFSDDELIEARPKKYWALRLHSGHISDVG